MCTFLCCLIQQLCHEYRECGKEIERTIKLWGGKKLLQVINKAIKREAWTHLLKKELMLQFQQFKIYYGQFGVLEVEFLI